MGIEINTQVPFLAVFMGGEFAVFYSNNASEFFLKKIKKSYIFSGIVCKIMSQTYN